MKKDTSTLVMTTTIDGEEYVALGCETFLRLNDKNQVLYSDDAIKVIFTPLFNDNSSSVLKDLSDRMKQVGLELLKIKKVENMQVLDFREDKKYKIFLHEKDGYVVGMVLRLLTQKELKNAGKPITDVEEFKKELHKLFLKKDEDLH